MYFYPLVIIVLMSMIMMVTMIAIVVRIMMFISMLILLMIIMITFQLPADDDIVKIEHIIHTGTDFPHVSTLTVRMMLLLFDVMNTHMCIRSQDLRVLWIKVMNLTDSLALYIEGITDRLLYCVNYFYGFLVPVVVTV